MELNMLSWNTQLYEYGTKNIDTGKIEKPFEKAPVEEVKKIVDDHMESNKNPIVVLQEIPFKRKNESNRCHTDPILLLEPVGSLFLSETVILCTFINTPGWYYTGR